MAKKNFVLLFLIILVGCNSTPQPSTTNPEPSPTVISHLTPVITLPSLTQKPGSTATATSLKIDIQCLDIKNQISSDIQGKGVLAIGSDPSSGLNNAYLLNLSTGKKIYVPLNPEETPESFVVSPDHNKLAYIAEGRSRNKSRLLVIDQEGEILFQKPVSTLEWAGIIEWLDNEKLLINKLQNNTGSLSTPASVIALNIKTGSIDEYFPNYPNIYKSDPLRVWGQYALSETVYDPTLNYVVYPDKDGNLVYWDVRQKQEITKLISANGFGNGPRWSPDGTKFISDVYVGKIIPPKQPWFDPEKSWQEELFVVNRDGATTQLTYLTKEYSDVDFGQYSWSLDGKNVAFWVRLKPDQLPDIPAGAEWVRRLAILNIQTQKLSFYCVQGDIEGKNLNGGKYSRVPEPPIWSPQNDKLFIDVRNGTNGNLTIIIDLFNNKVLKVSDGMIPIGWLNASP